MRCNLYLLQLYFFQKYVFADAFLHSSQSSIITHISYPCVACFFSKFLCIVVFSLYHFSFLSLYPKVTGPRSSPFLICQSKVSWSNYLNHIRMHFAMLIWGVSVRVVIAIVSMGFNSDGTGRSSASRFVSEKFGFPFIYLACSLKRCHQHMQQGDRAYNLRAEL